MKLEQRTRLNAADVGRLALVVVPVGGLSLAALGSSIPSWHGLRTVVALDGFWESFTFTVVTASVATVLAAVGAVGVGFAIGRRARAPRRSTITVLGYNLALPHLVWAIALVDLLSPSGWLARIAAAIGAIERPDQFPLVVNDRHGIGIVVHLVTKELPFLLLATLPLTGPRLRDELAQAATLGARWTAQIRHVYLPRIAPAFVPAVLVSLAYAIGGYEPAAVLGSQRPRTLAVVALEWFRDPTLARRDEAFALGAILLLVTVVLGGGFVLLARRAWWLRRPRTIR